MRVIMQFDQTDHCSPTDFLDEIVCGEERTYGSVYQDAFLQACGGTHDPAHDEAGRKECANSYQLGVYHGAKLGSELCSLYGLIVEVLDKSNEFGDQSLGKHRLKRNATVLKAAGELEALLTQSPGLLKLGDDRLPVGINFNQLTFDRDMSLIRSKARLLFNLLDVHVIAEATNQLNF